MTAAPETIRVALRPTSLGSVLVAVSGEGVCALLIGDDAEFLRDDLRRRFRKARLDAADKADARLADAAAGLVERPAAPAPFPLDARGSPFQQRVWAALREVAPGRTASYADIARAIGSATALRAVAGACAANPIAIAIPCHRILRSDGALSGYRWGVERKRQLLAREGVLFQPDASAHS